MWWIALMKVVGRMLSRMLNNQRMERLERNHVQLCTYRLLVLAQFPLFRALLLVLAPCFPIIGCALPTQGLFPLWRPTLPLEQFGFTLGCALPDQEGLPAVIPSNLSRILRNTLSSLYAYCGKSSTRSGARPWISFILSPILRSYSKLPSVVTTH